MKYELSKKRVIARILLFFYIGFIIYTTLLCREPRDYREYNFQLFWSYQRFFDDIEPQGKQIVCNILFFIPFGVLVPLCVNGSRKQQLVFTVISACLLSGTVEFLQLILKLGFAEFDDVFDNTLGAAIGAVLVLMLMKLKGKEMSHKPYGPYEKYFKRPIDLFCGLAAVIVFSWLYLILIILGAIFMRGNPFFTQARPGKDEKIFKLIKFRTMDNRKDRDGKLLPDEVRLNKYGRFLRKTSLDELPEAFNIIKGDMSIIGPRPLMARYLAFYTDEEKRRHDVRPGLSGYAQIHGRNNVNWEERLKLDIYYVDHVSFRMDVKVIIETIAIVLKRDGISTEDMSNFDDFRKKQLQENGKMEEK